MVADQSQDGQDLGRRHETARVAVNLACEIRVGKRNWRKAEISDLTPGGFQVTILDMPQRGTPVFVRIAGLQMLQAEVCWTKVNTAGCKFLQPLSQYTFDHILRTLDN